MALLGEILGLGFTIHMLVWFPFLAGLLGPSMKGTPVIQPC
jgi:hypothetical protein